MATPTDISPNRIERPVGRNQNRNLAAADLLNNAAELLQPGAALAELYNLRRLQTGFAASVAGQPNPHPVRHAPDNLFPTSHAQCV